jgi:hypothetical protein
MSDQPNKQGVLQQQQQQKGQLHSRIPGIGLCAGHALGRTAAQHAAQQHMCTSPFAATVAQGC